MHVLRSALGGLILGAAVGFVVALLRPRPRSSYAASTITPVGRP
jgi:gas vesicle protein